MGGGGGREGREREREEREREREREERERGGINERICKTLLPVPNKPYGFCGR